MVSGCGAGPRTQPFGISAGSEAMMMDRRSFLQYAGLVPLIGAMPRLAFGADETNGEKADYTLRIGTGLVELAPDRIVSTTLYNGQFPGPLLRFKEGQQVVVDVHNDTDTPELVHWHGQMIPSDVDGAAEEGTPFAAVKELQRIGKAADEEAEEKTKGFEVGYELFGINGRMLGHGEPIRVKAGERVLFHVLNASATEIRSLALPGHLFRIIALDGNPVPMQADVPVLWLGTAERISALVEMKHPGVWVMGDLADDDRKHGMGIVVEYAGQKGRPQWIKPKPFHWDYTQFGKANEAPAAPDETIEITIVKHNGALNGFNQWTLNGEAFSMETRKPMFTVHEGRRYRLKFRNASDDIHPLHLHRHSFELTRIAGKAMAGVIRMS